MKLILVWWIVSPHHMQQLHFEYFKSEVACYEAGEAIPAPTNKIVRWHCSEE